MKCPTCGNDNTSDAQFCTGCGSSLGASTANGMKERLRDKSREELAYALNSVGVKAEMAERGRAEEKVEDSWYQRSLGVIDILEASIKWVNILKRDAGQNNPPKWWVVLGILDERSLSSHQEIKIKTVRKKTFPLFGKVADVVWKGYDGNTGLVNTLSKDLTTKTLAKRIGNLEIKSQANGFQGWTLTVDRRFSPTSQEWETLEKIAGYILSSPRSL
jgi:hypothetical protein